MTSSGRVNTSAKARLHYLISSSTSDSFVPRESNRSVMLCFNLDSAKLKNSIGCQGVKQFNLYISEQSCNHTQYVFNRLTEFSTEISLIKASIMLLRFLKQNTSRLGKTRKRVDHWLAIRDCHNIL